LLLSPAVAQSTELAGSEWRPQWADGVTSPQGTETFVRFEAEGRVTGHGGCNRYFGSYKITGDAVEFGPLGATRMACPNPIMDWETALFKVLEAAKTFKRDGANLTLFDAGGEELLQLLQTDWD
jgi:heat shock protein HslJ